MGAFTGTIAEMKESKSQQQRHNHDRDDGVLACDWAASRLYHNDNDKSVRDPNITGWDGKELRTVGRRGSSGLFVLSNWLPFSQECPPKPPCHRFDRLQSG